jgi:hypothetical protein
MRAFFLILVICAAPALADDDAPAQAEQTQATDTQQADEAPQEPSQAGANAAAEVTATEPDDPAPNDGSAAQGEVPVNSQKPEQEEPAEGQFQITQPIQQRLAPNTDQQLMRPQTMAEALNTRLQRLLVPPSPATDPVKIQRQLDFLNDNAAKLAEVAQTDKEKLYARNVELNGRYARVNMFAEAPDVDAELGRLRAAARRVKALYTPEAGAIGDFWLMTADLFDINRLQVPLAERQRQAAQVLDEYLDRHPKGPASEYVADAAAKMSRARGLTPPAPANDPPVSPPTATDASQVADAPSADPATSNEQDTNSQAQQPAVVGPPPDDE